MMESLHRLYEPVESVDVSDRQQLKISETANAKFTQIMQDELSTQFGENEQVDDRSSLSTFLKMYSEEESKDGFQLADESKDDENIEINVPNTEFESSGSVYETDDNGKIYKQDGTLLSNAEYTVNGNRYKTDEYGHPVSCDSSPVHTDEGVRNNKEQKESGGEERLDNDDGGHIIARVLGGAEGIENLVPMRRTINRGDYKKNGERNIKGTSGRKACHSAH